MRSFGDLKIRCPRGIFQVLSIGSEGDKETQEERGERWWRRRKRRRKRLAPQAEIWGSVRTEVLDFMTFLVVQS